MRKKKLFCFLAALIGFLSVPPANAEPESPYKVDFNTKIDTSKHDFKVASNWKHIVDSYSDSWGDESFMTYSYSETEGVGKTGTLRAGEQRISIGWSDYKDLNDLLVTPVVSGEVSVQAKVYSYYTSSAYVEFYTITEDGKRGELIQKFDKNSGLNSSDFTKFTIDVPTAGRVGIRAQYVYLDDFEATTANIEKERKMIFASVDPADTSGTLYWDQQADKKVFVKFTVTVTNTGEVDLKQNDEGYSVSLVTSDKTLCTVPVPQDLKVGETSEPFEVSVSIEPTEVWKYYYSTAYINLREDLQGEVSKRASSKYNPYESKFLFRLKDTNGSNLSESQSFGMITVDEAAGAVKEYEIYNDGVAPLEVKSVSITGGFILNQFTTPLTIAKEKKQLVTVSVPNQKGSYNGKLSIVYVDNQGADRTHSVDFSANVVLPGIWTADFNAADGSDNGPAYPAGSVAQSGINSSRDYKSGIYDFYLKSYSSNDYATADNMFITPLLTAEAGEEMTFDVRSDDDGSSHFVKVYTSTDRVNWSETPVCTVENPGTQWTSHSFNAAQAGNLYVGFAIYGARLDNVVGFRKVDVPRHLCQVGETR